ncbi:hypothetical protein ACFPK9_01595 [Rubritalea spongiae]|uniref:Esterase n=1 Tax=Rubritalea spongiae TaxID=430797 RepID=A0ABW5DYY1_9BACT
MQLFYREVILTLSLGLHAIGAPDDEVRSFTRSSDNKSIEAHVVSYDGKQVVLAVQGKKNYTFDSAIFTEDDQQYFQKWVYTSKGMPAPNELDPRIKPSATFRVEMPNLAQTYTNKPAGFTISLPPNYSYPEATPLLVFLNGGTGSESLKQAKTIAGSMGYILVSLPYTSEIDKDGPLGNSEKNMELIEAYHSVMLERLRKLVPNLSQTHRVIVGSSNGAHIIGSAIAMDWDCYLDYFNAFALWEGGGSISRNFKAARGKEYQVWVGWGEKSEFKDFTIGVAEAMDESRVNVTQQAVKTAGHGLNKEATLLIKEWLKKIAEPHMQGIGS